MYLELRPEVPGWFGPETVIDTATYPPTVSKAHLIIEDWLGDDLVQCFPCHFVTKRLKRYFLTRRLEGVSFEPITVAAGEQFYELSPGSALPDLCRMRVMTPAGKGELGITNEMQLVANSIFFEDIRSQFQVCRCSSAEWHIPPEQLSL